MVLKIFRLWNILSLDVAVGAVCGSLFFCNLFDVIPAVAIHLVLFLSVWLVYTADHILDAFKIARHAVTERHRFHYRHRKWMMMLSAMAVGLILVFLNRLPSSVLYAGSILTAATVLYFVLHQRVPAVKEVVVASIYTAGVLLPAVMGTPMVLEQWPWLVVVMFWLLANLNLFLFSWFDYKVDLLQGTPSFATRMGRTACFYVICGLALTIIVFSVVDFRPGVFLLFVAMMCLHLLPLAFPSAFSANNIFRVMGDFAFVLPGFYWLLS